MSTTINLGAFADSLSVQLKGFNIESKKLDKWQKISDSITMLSLHEYLTEKQTMAARNKLVKEIQLEV